MVILDFFIFLDFLWTGHEEKVFVLQQIMLRQDYWKNTPTMVLENILSVFKLRGGASMPTFVGRSVGLSVRL